MKFQLTGTELHKVLSTVIKGFNIKEDNSYVAFKLDPDEGQLTVTSRSRGTYFEGKIKAHSVSVVPDEALTYHLDGAKLKQLVTVLPSAPVGVNFEINEKLRSFVIKTASDSFKLPVLSETPLADTPVVEELVTVDANELMKTMKDLIRIVSTEQSAQEHQISCMHFHLENSKVSLSATDSYAFGSISIDASGVTLEDDKTKDVLIRHTEVSTLMESFATGETLTIVGSDDMFGYIDENQTLSLVGLIDMTPLDTKQLEAITKNDNTVTVDKGELKSAIETVSKLSPSDETVDIDLDEKEVKVSNRYGDSIRVAVSESDLASPGGASFATSVLQKIINPANTGNLRLEFGPFDEGGALRVASLHPDGTAVEETVLIATLMER